MRATAPEEAQERVVEHLREHIQDLQDKLLWGALFRRTRDQLAPVACRAKKEQL